MVVLFVSRVEMITTANVFGTLCRDCHVVSPAVLEETLAASQEPLAHLYFAGQREASVATRSSLVPNVV